MHIETLAIHAGGEPDKETGAVAPPIHLATTFQHGPAGERVAGFEYQREANPTQSRLEECLAALEQGEAALAFASGMAAMNVLLECLPSGAEILIPRDCYGGLRSLGEEFLPERGITMRAVNMTDLNSVLAAVSERTQWIWLETPSNPLLEISDIKAIAALCKEKNLRLVCDNTFATPILQQPLLLGADVVMHSTTKYFGGHSDVMGGALVFAKRDGLQEKVAHRRHITGNILSPFSAWLILRGARSLAARMTWHCNNARKIAEFLATHSCIEKVNFPGLVSHPNHDIAKKQMRDFGGMLSVHVKGGREATLEFASRL
ncbi:MAG: aminotransferase class I/II-fold pyridoxal phosphate-dependent enzyme, partial [Arenimonas sp.]